MNNTTNVKRGRGRPAGATSFVNVALSDLDQFVGASTPIPVSRVWLEKMGLTIERIAPTVAEVKTEDNQPKVEFKLTKL